MHLKDAKTSWIETIKLSADDLTAKVRLNVPVGDKGEVANYEEVIALDGAPKYLAEAALKFSEAAVTYIAERENTKGESLCVSCTGACCGRIFTEVSVYEHDIPALPPHGYTLYENGKQINGSVGVLSRIPWSGEGDASFDGDERPMACIFLDTKTSLCSIYNRRPSTCREYTDYDCDEHEQASEKLVKIRRKAFSASDVT